MNQSAVLKLLTLIKWAGLIVVFSYLAAFFGGIAYIWVSTYFGVTMGAIAGLTVGIGIALLTLLIVRTLLHWIIPDLRETQRQQKYL